MAEEAKPTTVRVQQVGFGGVWFGGWLFTIGFAQLDLVQSLVGIIVWPYFLGTALG